jgi:hypothetical protein
LADTVQADSVEPFENVVALAMPRSMAMFVDKALNVFEACNDPLLLRRARSDPLGLDLNAKFGEEGVIIISKISHL